MRLKYTDQFGREHEVKTEKVFVDTDTHQIKIRERPELEDVEVTVVKDSQAQAILYLNQE